MATDRTEPLLILLELQSKTSDVIKSIDIKIDGVPGGETVPCNVDALATISTLLEIYRNLLAKFVEQDARWQDLAESLNEKFGS